MASPTTPTTKISHLDLNVRQLFENNSVDNVREVHRKVSHEIDRKREDLRTLVGESYRDLIDAADTIAVMKSSSVSIAMKLRGLRQNIKSIPTQLTNANSTKSSREKRLTSAELEIAAELKLTLETPRQVQSCLEQSKSIEGLHLYLLTAKKLSLRSRPYKWTFLEDQDNNNSDPISSMKNSILSHCERVMEDFTASSEVLAAQIITLEVLTQQSCEDVLKSFLEKQLQNSKVILEDDPTKFIHAVAFTISSLHSIFIEPQLYSAAAKQVRTPNISMKKLGLNYTPKLVDSFNREMIEVDEPPRVTRLAEIIVQYYVIPLKEMLEQSYNYNVYLKNEDSLEVMENYRKSTVLVLKAQCEDMSRIILGTTKSLWSEVFSSVFYLKCQAVILNQVLNIIQSLQDSTFPRLERLDNDFDLINFVWTPSGIGSKVSPLEDDLKLKCISPHVAEINQELEIRCKELLADSQNLGDNLLKEFISNNLTQHLEGLFEELKVSSPSLLLGRWCATIGEFCPTLWKLLRQNDAIKMRQILASVSETCCSAWTNSLLDKFQRDLEAKNIDFNASRLTQTMPVAEDYTSESEGALKPSIKVPIQISHALQSCLFSICLDFGRIGPQSIPKNVRDNFRLAVGKTLAESYDNLDLDQLCSQAAIQLIFDLKYVQWFHPKLSTVIEPSTTKLQAIIDPFDLDIVNPRLKVNLKRCLFENHLTLGLLFSEESHGFVAQNFKTKGNQNFPTANNIRSSPLPLLPI